jgi:hypothetical protein
LQQSQPLTEKQIKSRWIKDKLEKRDWSVKDGVRLYMFPRWLLQRVYSKVDMVVYEGRFTKGTLEYPFIPGEYTIDKVPIIIDVNIVLHKLPDNSVRLSFSEMKQIFANNKFQD